ncbi:MAG: TetR/AcrR family transcriptional regulator, partial [Acidobacteriota bacterium]
MGRNADKNKQQKEQTRTRLLEAGRRVVLQKGLRGTRVREIAREAKVGIGTFYAYFPNLEGLLLEVTQLAIAHILRQVREARGLRDGSAFE